MGRFWHSFALCAALVMSLLMTPLSDVSDAESSDDAGQYFQVGATFFAVAMMVWSLCFEVTARWL